MADIKEVKTRTEEVKRRRVENEGKDKGEFLELKKTRLKLKIQLAEEERRRKEEKEDKRRRKEEKGEKRGHKTENMENVEEFSVVETENVKEFSKLLKTPKYEDERRRKEEERQCEKEYYRKHKKKKAVKESLKKEKKMAQRRKKRFKKKLLKILDQMRRKLREGMNATSKEVDKKVEQRISKKIGNKIPDQSDMKSGASRTSLVNGKCQPETAVSYSTEDMQVPTISMNRSLKPPTFDGETSWPVYRRQFRAAVSINGWNNQQKATVVNVIKEGACPSISKSS